MEVVWVGGGVDEYGLSWLELCGGGGRVIQVQGGREDGVVFFVKVLIFMFYFFQWFLVIFLYRLVLVYF